MDSTFDGQYSARRDVGHDKGVGLLVAAEHPRPVSVEVESTGRSPLICTCRARMAHSGLSAVASSVFSWIKSETLNEDRVQCPPAAASALVP